MQTGDPTHTGKGGTSIWGRKFEDEFKENLKVFTFYIIYLNNGNLLIINFISNLAQRTRNCVYGK